VAVAAAATDGLKPLAIALPDATSETIRQREERVLTADLAQLASNRASLSAQHAERAAARDRLSASIAAREELLALTRERADMRESLIEKGALSRALVIDSLQQHQTHVTTNTVERKIGLLSQFRDSLRMANVVAWSQRFAAGERMPELKIRKDRTPAVLRKLAKEETDARVARRLLAIANALSGMSRKEAALSAGMDRQTLRDWVIRYNAHGVAGLLDQWGGGRPPVLTSEQQAELLEIVLAGPDPEKDGYCAFTRDDLVAIAKKRFGKSMHPVSMGRLLKRLDLSRQKARPSHPLKDPAAAAAFKKSPANVQKPSAYT
jgi:transposase